MSVKWKLNDTTTLKTYSEDEINEAKTEDLELYKVDTADTIGELVTKINSNFENLAKHGGGPSGKDGTDGEDGEDGQDGGSAEFIYALSNEMAADVNYPSTTDEKKNLFEDAENAGSSGHLFNNTTRWYDNPQGVSEDRNTEYMMCRTRRTSNDGIVGAWIYSDPTIWAHWGEKGTDGDGVEYIFTREDNPEQPLKRENMQDVNYGIFQQDIFNITDFYPGEEWFTDTNKAAAKKTIYNAGHEITDKYFETLWNARFYFQPLIWTDNPQGVGKNNPKEYVSIRRHVSETTSGKVWGDFSTPQLWSNYSMSSRIFMVYYNAETNETVTKPQGGWWDTENDKLIKNKTGYKLTDGWSDTNTDISGKIAWCSSGTFNEDGKNISWSNPFRITGADGENGKDGTTIEFIYTLLDSEIQPKNYPSDKDDIERLFNNVENDDNSDTDAKCYEYYDDDTETTTTWYDNAQAITETYKFEYAWSRIKDVSSNKWTYDSKPALWARWGEDGTDGDGIEYIFTRTTKEDSIIYSVPTESHSGTYKDKNGSAVSSITWNTPEYMDQFSGELTITNGNNTVKWTDNPQGVDVNNTCEWVSIRKKTCDSENKTGVYGEFSTPKLWAKYSKDGATPFTYDLTNQTFTMGVGDDKIYNTTEDDMVTYAAIQAKYGTKDAIIENFETNYVIDDPDNNGKITLEWVNEYANAGLTTTDSTKVFKVTISHDDTNFEHTKQITFTFDLRYKIDTEDSSKDIVEEGCSLTFNIVGLAYGKDGSIYELIPGSHIIVKKKDGTYNPTVLCCNASNDTIGDNFIIKKLAGNNTTSDLSTLFSSTEDYPSDGIELSSSYDTGVTFFLFYGDENNNYTCIDNEYIPVVSDGSDGTSLSIKGVCNYEKYYTDPTQEYTWENSEALIQELSLTGEDGKILVIFQTTPANNTGLTDVKVFVYHNNSWLRANGANMTSLEEGYSLMTPLTGHMLVWDGDSWVDAGKIKGETGETGNSIWIKYAEISTADDGGTEVSDKGYDGYLKLTSDPSEADYIGTYTAKEVSTDLNDYTWSKFKGEDGFGYEYIYKATSSTDSAPDVPTDGSEKSDWDNPEYLPTGWVDDPISVSSTNKYVWMCWRERKDGVWTQFIGIDGKNSAGTGKAKLWARYAEDGEPGSSGDTYQRKYARFTDSWGTFTDVNLITTGSATSSEPSIEFTYDTNSKETISFGELDNEPKGADEDHCIEVMIERYGHTDAWGEWSTPVITSRQFSDDEIESKVNAFLADKDYQTESDVNTLISSGISTSIDGTASDTIGGAISASFTSYEADSDNKLGKLSNTVTNIEYAKTENGKLIDNEGNELNYTSTSTYVAEGGSLSNLRTVVTQLATVSQTVTEHSSTVGIVANTLDSTGKDNITAAIFAEANEEGSSITLGADKINLSGKTMAFSGDEITITGDNFNLDADGNVDMKGTVTATGGEISGTLKIFDPGENDGSEDDTLVAFLNGDNSIKDDELGTVLIGAGNISNNLMEGETFYQYSNSDNNSTTKLFSTDKIIWGIDNNTVLNNTYIDNNKVSNDEYTGKYVYNLDDSDITPEQYLNIQDECSHDGDYDTFNDYFKLESQYWINNINVIDASDMSQPSFSIPDDTSTLIINYDDIILPYRYDGISKEYGDSSGYSYYFHMWVLNSDIAEQAGYQIDQSIPTTLYTSGNMLYTYAFPIDFYNTPYADEWTLYPCDITYRYFRKVYQSNWTIYDGENYSEAAPQNSIITSSIELLYISYKYSSNCQQIKSNILTSYMSNRNITNISEINYSDYKQYLNDNNYSIDEKYLKYWIKNIPYDTEVVKIVVDEEASPTAIPYTTYVSMKIYNSDSDSTKVFTAYEEESDIITKNPIDFINTVIYSDGTLRTNKLEATSGKFTGEIQATSGKFTGEIQATSGKIGGLTVTTNNLSWEDNLGRTTYIGGTGTTISGILKSRSCVLENVYYVWDDRTIDLNTSHFYAGELGDAMKYNDIISFIGTGQEELPHGRDYIGRKFIFAHNNPQTNSTSNSYGTCTFTSGGTDIKFYEDGIYSNTLKISNELVELLGYGYYDSSAEKHVFKGWLVTNRKNIKTKYSYGHEPTALGYICFTSSSSVSKYYSYDANTITVEQSSNIYTITWPSTWNISSANDIHISASCELGSDTISDNSNYITGVYTYVSSNQLYTKIKASTTTFSYIKVVAFNMAQFSSLTGSVEFNTASYYSSTASEVYSTITGYSKLYSLTWGYNVSGSSNGYYAYIDITSNSTLEVSCNTSGAFTASNISKVLTSGSSNVYRTLVYPNYTNTGEYAYKTGKLIITITHDDEITTLSYTLYQEPQYTDSGSSSS